VNILNQKLRSEHIKLTLGLLIKHVGEFENLLIGDYKRFLLDCLDKNYLYINYSEIDDEEYGVSEEDKKLNREFYK